MRRYAQCLLAFSLLFACGSESTTAPVDAGLTDVITDAVAERTISNVPEAAPLFDAGSECDRLKAIVDQNSALARACNPQDPQPCGAAVNGLCCLITVSSSSNGSVADLQDAVRTYTATCNPDCTKSFCSVVPPPSNVCDSVTRTCH